MNMRYSNESSIELELNIVINNNFGNSIQQAVCVMQHITAWETDDYIQSTLFHQSFIEKKTWNISRTFWCFTLGPNIKGSLCSHLNISCVELKLNGLCFLSWETLSLYPLEV